MDRFKIIVKRSELDKAENLFKKGKIEKRNLNGEDYWIEKTKDTIYIWQVWSGYYGKQDGWIQSWEHSVPDFEKAIKEIEENIIAYDGDYDTYTIIEIDETK